MVPSASVPEPINVVVLVGSVRLLSAPALEVGATFKLGLTIILISFVQEAPLLSLTVSLIT